MAAPRPRAPNQPQEQALRSRRLSSIPIAKSVTPESSLTLGRLWRAGHDKQRRPTAPGHRLTHVRNRLRRRLLLLLCLLQLLRSPPRHRLWAEQSQARRTQCVVAREAKSKSAQRRWVCVLAYCVPIAVGVEPFVARRPPNPTAQDLKPLSLPSTASACPPARLPLASPSSFPCPPRLSRPAAPGPALSPSPSGATPPAPGRPSPPPPPPPAAEPPPPGQPPAACGGVRGTAGLGAASAGGARGSRRKEQAVQR